MPENTATREVCDGCSDSARRALVIELMEGLKVRKHWVPRDGMSSDLINAVFRAVDRKPEVWVVQDNRNASTRMAEKVCYTSHQAAEEVARNLRKITGCLGESIQAVQLEVLEE